MFMKPYPQYLPFRKLRLQSCLNPPDNSRKMTTFVHLDLAQTLEQKIKKRIDKKHGRRKEHSGQR